MIQATFWSTLAWCIAFPTIHLEIMREIDSRLFALNSIVIACGTIVSNSCFNKWGDKIFKQFILILLIESICFTTTGCLVLAGVFTAKMFFLVEMVTVATLTRCIVCSGKRLRRLIYEGEEREKYDINDPIAMSAATILGGVIALIGIPSWLAWVVMMIGVSIDNVFYVVIYKKATK